MPKGWVTPTSGRKLRIAVPGPVEPGFHSFLDVESDPATNVTLARGFVIDVFEAAVRQLPYALLFEYEPYRNANGTSGGDYNTLVKQVYDKVSSMIPPALRLLLLRFPWRFYSCERKIPMGLL